MGRHLKRRGPVIYSAWLAPSLHLTFGITQPTGSAYLRWLADQLDKNPEIRAAIPHSVEEDLKSEWLLGFRTLVEQAMTLPSVDAFLGREVAMQLARPQFNLPDFERTPPSAWSASTIFRLSSTRRLDVRVGDDGTASVAAANRQLSCPAAIAPALRRLSSSQPVRLDTLETEVGPQAGQDLRRTLAIMVTLGILFSE